MGRLLLLALLAALALPVTANAKAPCRDKIYNDWYRDGKIASTYPLSCYRDAIAHVPNDARVYSSLQDDIRRALQAATARLHGKRNVPEQVGSGITKGKGAVENARATLRLKKRGDTRTTGSTTTSRPTHLAAPSTDPHGGGGIPVPILVLGGLALLLAATGAAGAAVRHIRRRP